MAVFVVDPSGHLVSADAMDGVRFNDIRGAQGKAFTAATFRETTQSLSELIETRPDRYSGIYAVIDISEITDPEVFTKQLLPKTAAALAAFGGQFVIRTENIAGIDGTPPKRFVVIAFNSAQAAKAWSSSAAQKEIETMRMKSTKSRAFIADGTIQ